MPGAAVRVFWKLQDVWAGLLIMALGGLALWLAGNLAMGQAVRMGPGYVPRILAGVVVALGAVVCGRGLVAGGVSAGSWALRPLAVILASIVAFGFLIERLGLVLASIALVTVARVAAGRERPVETVALAMALAAFAAATFVGLLGLPFKLWPA